MTGEHPPCRPHDSITNNLTRSVINVHDVHAYPQRQRWQQCMTTIHPPQRRQWSCVVYVHLCSPSMMMTSTTSPSVIVDDNDRHPQKLSQQYNIGMTISNHAWRHSDTYIRFLLSSRALSTPPAPFPFAPSTHPIPGYHIHSR